MSDISAYEFCALNYVNGLSPTGHSVSVIGRISLIHTVFELAHPLP